MSTPNPFGYPDISQIDIYTAVRTFVLNIPIAATYGPNYVIRGGLNRVAPPSPAGATNTGGTMTVMQIIRLTPIATPVETWDETNSAPTSTNIEQSIECTIQLSISGQQAMDAAASIAAAWRTEYACDILAVPSQGGNPSTCQPLYCEDPILAPYIDEADQWNEQWIVTAHLQYNPNYSTSQDFANTLTVDLINVDEEYPP